MNPDLAQAIPKLVDQGILGEEQARPLLRVARRELVSIYPELRLMFYLGVLLIAGGAGVLVENNYARIGPVAATVSIGLAAVAAFWWVARKAAPFSWEEVPSTSPAFDYVLLLGVLLASADLAFVEYQFTPLGKSWPWHLLIVSLVMGALSVRFDSKTVFSLALSTFAAWRGVSTSLIEHALWRTPEDVVRWNAIACGVLFVLLGRCLTLFNRKAHFEPVAVHLGWLLILGGLVSGIFGRGTESLVYNTLLLATAAALAYYAYQRYKFVLFAFGILGAYIAASVVAVEIVYPPLWFIVSAAALIAGLWAIQRKMKEPL
jgi:hypothetical protein